MQYRFVALDGVEGCGKSTQARLLAEELQARGLEVVLTHEPGGTALGARIRELLLDSDHSEMTPLTEALLFCADRAQHVAEVIRPALEAGRIVITDRFSSSTAAYQGWAGGLGFDLYDQINSAATGGLKPDLTLILDLDPAVGFARKFDSGEGLPDRIERRPAEFHERVREGFLRYAERLGEGARVIEADRTPDQLQQAIREILGLG